MRSGDFKETYGELVALTDSKPVWLWSLMLVAALIVAPYLLNSYALSFLTIILITAVGALGLNILTGYTGLISLGHVGFLVTGAYAYAVVVSKYGMPPIVGFLAAGIVPALASLIVGAPSLRLKGLYLAITTLAFAFIINTVILEARTVTNGARGISVRRPEIFGVSFDSDAAFTHLCLGFAILTLLATLNIRRSRVGAPPHSLTWPARTTELKSTMAPGFNWTAPLSTSSEPVGRMATVGRRRTWTWACPAATSAPRSTAPSR